MTDGEYRIGGSDDCDFILEDGSAGNLALRIGLDKGRMTVIEVMGLCYLDGEPINSGGLDLGAYQIITMGATHLAFGPADNEWPEFCPPRIKPPESAEVAQSPPDEGQADGIAAVEPEFAEEPLQADGTGAITGSRKDPDRDSNPDFADLMQAKPRKKKGRAAGIYKKIGVGVAVVCIVLMQQFLFRAKSPSHQAELAQARKNAGHLLERYQVTCTSLSLDAEGRLAISGFLEHVSDEKELSRQLEKIAFPKTIKLVAIDESLKTFEEVMQNYRLRLKVTYQKDGIFVLSGFVRDADLLRAILARLHEDMPMISQIKTRVHTHEDVIPAVFKELEKSGGIRGRIELQAHTDHIRVEGTFFPSDREIWANVRADIQKRFGNDIRFKEAFIVKPDPAPEVLPAAPVEKQNPLDELAGLKGQITGVILSPRRYLLTRDGKKCFEGGLLAGEYIVNSIKPDRIVLAKGANNISIPLSP